MGKKPVRVTDLATMGKCENLAKLKAQFGDRATEGVRRAAERGTLEHRRFEREKVSDSRCFVASWALGPEHSATEALRVWRDAALLPTRSGRFAVALYYAFSPFLIAVARRVPGAKILSAKILERIASAVRKAP